MTELKDTTCTSCGAPVRWVVTVTGRRIALDPDPHPGGNVIPTVEGGKPRARVLTGAEMPAQTVAWRQHAATCPRTRTDRALCTACRSPLDPALAAAEPWHTTHPTCDPTRSNT